MRFKEFSCLQPLLMDESSFTQFGYRDFNLAPVE
jgi:hypothetical protein